MTFSSRAGYFCAGALLTNGVPHLVIGLTGRRKMTPFGRNSSASVNVLWGCTNAVGGYLLVRRADRGAGAQADAGAWLVALEAGGLFWSLFMVTYELRQQAR